MLHGVVKVIGGKEAVVNIPSAKKRKRTVEAPPTTLKQQSAGIQFVWSLFIKIYDFHSIFQPSA